ncbi:restriction endonuclease [Halorussus caseinilyticus]|uniref:Restriction endonuclease n=1 Tax=Halorussus caseinilyticus TaxID=3034025 RepID=A0ABD5WIF7_9EURY
MPADPESAVATLTERVRTLREERAELNLDVLDHLGDAAKRAEAESGPTLGEIGVAASGVEDSVLADASADREGLKIGDVEVRRDGDGDALVVSTTARYKPDDAERDDAETDRWGYVETDPIPALRFRNLGETERTLLEAFVPAAVERGGGFAGFRAYATKTNTPLDRLRALSLPDPETVSDEVARYREVRARAKNLNNTVATLEEAIDRIVYRLYGLDDDEIAVVERAGDGGE